MDFNHALASQPANLDASRAAVQDQLAQLDLSPWRSGTIAVAAMGASSHAAHVFAAEMMTRGRRVYVFDAAEIAGYGPAANVADSFLLVTEGGRSRETIEAARAVSAAPRLALTNVAQAPIGEVADSVLVLGHGPDSKVYSVGYTCTVQAFGLLAEALTGAPAQDDWTALPDVVRSTLTDLPEHIGPLAKALAGLSSIDVIGSGAGLSAVHETALMLREGPRIPAAGYETYQYLHGPMESQGESTGCILFGGDREIRLAQYAARRHLITVLVTDADVPEEPNLTVLRHPKLPTFSAAVAQILPSQLLIGELTRLRGIDLDEFRYDQDDTKIGPPLAGEGH